MVAWFLIVKLIAMAKNTAVIKNTAPSEHKSNNRLVFAWIQRARMGFAPPAE
jgi:hypothetical protein